MMALLEIHVRRDPVKRLMGTAPHQPMTERDRWPVTEIFTNRFKRPLNSDSLKAGFERGFLAKSASSATRV